MFLGMSRSLLARILNIEGATLEIECGFAAQAELYDYLKGHPRGNLTPYFRYIISEKRGRYHVTAKCKSVYLIENTENTSYDPPQFVET
jgi:hypothetical protein